MTGGALLYWRYIVVGMTAGALLTLIITHLIKKDNTWLLIGILVFLVVGVIFVGSPDSTKAAGL